MPGEVVGVVGVSDRTTATASRDRRQAAAPPTDPVPIADGTRAAGRRAV